MRPLFLSLILCLAGITVANKISYNLDQKEQTQLRKMLKVKSEQLLKHSKVQALTSQFNKCYLQIKIEKHRLKHHCERTLKKTTAGNPPHCFQAIKELVFKKNKNCVEAYQEKRQQLLSLRSTKIAKN